MTIVYLGNFESPYLENSEKYIKHSLEKLGHKVIPINERGYSIEEIVKQDKDLFLFHKGTRFGEELIKLVELLNKVTCPKVFWYFDKVWKGREQHIDTIMPFVDKGFVTDGSFARQHNYKNLHILRQGCMDIDTSLGKPKEKYKCKVAFLGSVYGRRQEFVSSLKNIYGDFFRVFNNIFGRKLYNLCASVPIIVAPKFPDTDFYWSNRIYMTLGSGGFLIHPRLEGLKEEFKDGKHFAGYSSGRELVKKIDYYLEHTKEREKIRMAGYKYVTKNFTWTKRCEKLIHSL